ncbi:MAG: family 1 glycosylhydrolase [Vulcanimicrobiaceae bacterium]
MNRKHLGRFPAGFLFGVATADHQCEAFDPRFPDIFDDWEVEHRLQQRDRASDFWNRYLEDIDLAKALGCNAFRFSVAWARVEPEAGHYDEANIAHYRGLVDALRERGMEPIVTLLHNVWPRHVQAAGGLLADDFPERFATYARLIAERLGAGVTYYVSLNEPTQLPFGFIKPWWARSYPIPPGMPASATESDQMDAVAKLIPNLFRAHTQARAAIQAVNPKAKLGTNPLLLGLPVWLQRLVDWHATRVTEATLGEHSRHFVSRHIPFFSTLARFVGIVTTLLNGNWWHLGMAGKLPAFLCPPECVGTQDYVGLDYYWGIPALRVDLVERLMEAAQQKYSQAPVWPNVLFDLLRYYGEMFPNEAIIVIENGCVTSADGVRRDRYIREHVHQVKRALNKGVNVMGYLVWSITSNREWGLPFGLNSDFGLYHVDLDTDPALKREPTPAADAYRQIIAERSATVKLPAGEPAT